MSLFILHMLAKTGRRDKVGTMRIFLIFLLCLVVVGVSLLMLLQEKSSAMLPTEIATITTPLGSVQRFRLEVAREAPDLERGLMFRTALAPDAGMIFIFPVPQEIKMWMKNTLIPLDMLFIGFDGVIHTLHSNAKPQDMTVITSGGVVVAAVEIAGGRAAELGIVEGSRISSDSLTPLFH